VCAAANVPRRRSSEGDAISIAHAQHRSYICSAWQQVRVYRVRVASAAGALREQRQRSSRQSPRALPAGSRLPIAASRPGLELDGPDSALMRRRSAGPHAVPPPSGICLLTPRHGGGGGGMLWRQGRRAAASGALQRWQRQRRARPARAPHAAQHQQQAELESTICPLSELGRRGCGCRCSVQNQLQSAESERSGASQSLRAG
jgi:hypothetical protein